MNDRADTKNNLMLLADVGGTNARLALARDGALLSASIQRFRGDDHDSFDEVVRLYMQQQGLSAVDAVCVAVAGPVTDGHASLTNRAWRFSQSGLSALTGAPRAQLINDMVALGYATPGLGVDGLEAVRAVSGSRPHNGQRLVINAGTGFNVCAVKVLASGGIVCLESEQGHVRLPQPIATVLAQVLPASALPAFDSCEELLAGRGLARLHAARLGLPYHPAPEMRAEAVVAAAQAGDGDARESCVIYARCFGLMCRDLVMAFMPLEGLFLAGSVARSAMAYRDEFEQAFLGDPLMGGITQSVPISVIRDDMAALHGCLAALG